MDFLLFLFCLAVFLHAIMAIAWGIALLSGKSGFIDAVWSLSVGAAGVAAALLPFGTSETLISRRLLVGVMAALWSARLGLHILRRTFGGGDDPRYAKLKENWGKRTRLYLFLFLQAQALAAWPLVLAMLLASRNPAPLIGFSDWIGVALFLGAIWGEAAADQQLTLFRSGPENRGLICDRGLWARSRHPNYFFEWLGWLAYCVIAIGLPGSLYPWGLISLGAPVIMYHLLVNVSGIPPLEDYLRRSRPEAFRLYAEKVPAFWPRLVWLKSKET
jgi:steroid 5-alpha reductase family enzyme